MSAKKADKKKAAANEGPQKKLIASNKRALHDYFIDQTWEAGIVLTGTEVKSLRDRGASLIDGYCYVDAGEVWMDNAHIAPYVKGTWTNHAARRKRKLLMHKREIANLFGKTKQDGYALIPLSVYFKNSRVKVEIGLCKGKKLYDKRDSIAARDAKREMDRAMKERNR